jgi:Helix-turn-helix
MTERLIRTSADWAVAFRARKAELGYSDAMVEERAGLPDGYCSKILNAKKKPGAKKIEQLSRGLDLEVFIRPAAAEK